MSVEDTKEYCIKEFRDNISNRECNQVVFFYQRKNGEEYYGKDAIEKMCGMDEFVVYEKGALKEAIIEYIQRNE